MKYAIICGLGQGKISNMVDVNVSHSSKATLIEVSGRVDSMSAHELGKAFQTAVESGQVSVVLDLSQVDYMSSAGLREIVTAFKNLRKKSGDLRIAEPSDRVREVLEFSGLDSVFRIFPSQAAAVASY